MMFEELASTQSYVLIFQNLEHNTYIISYYIKLTNNNIFTNDTHTYCGIMYLFICIRDMYYLVSDPRSSTTSDYS